MKDRGGVGGSHHILMLKSELKSIMTSKACKLLIMKARSWRRPKPFLWSMYFLLFKKKKKNLGISEYPSYLTTWRVFISVFMSLQRVFSSFYLYHYLTKVFSSFYLYHYFGAVNSILGEQIGRYLHNLFSFMHGVGCWWSSISL